MGEITIAGGFLPNETLRIGPPLLRELSGDSTLCVPIGRRLLRCDAANSDALEPQRERPENMEDILGEVAAEAGVETEIAEAVIDEFMLLLHRGLYESNGDYIAGSLRWQLGPQAFYHLLCFFDVFMERYNWDEGSASEYLLRMPPSEQWFPYRDQCKSWQPRSK